MDGGRWNACADAAGTDLETNESTDLESVQRRRTQNGRRFQAACGKGAGAEREEGRREAWSVRSNYNRTWNNSASERRKQLFATFERIRRIGRACRQSTHCSASPYDIIFHRTAEPAFVVGENCEMKLDAIMANICRETPLVDLSSVAARLRFSIAQSEPIVCRFF